ncbi:MAG: carboxymuconolactone decarboxylase family protein [Methanobacteriaceae archaeon]|jgi:alkylhydroperoxidase/carboxymuconolactone decarboxylase family protein YurZ|nr:carboxymuconolactone decarboxylase family protein [Methanobacteriaceae archaeon]
MKNEVFYGKGIRYIKDEDPELYEAFVKLNESVYTGKVLSYKTQKLIAIGIAAAKSDGRALKKQMQSGMEELDITKDEILDVLKVVLLTSGSPAYNKSVNMLYSI